MTWARRQDSNQANLVKHINLIPGCQVLDLSRVGGGCPDILVQQKRAGMLTRLLLIEIKTDKGKLNYRQKYFHDQWSCYVARNLDDILKILELY